MTESAKTCPHCNSRMTPIMKDGRTKYVCATCDADPMNALRINNLINASGLQPPKD
jgi:DNA-directed RNA polymerase subunit M/transcription elongation factor TFIIS